MGDLTDEMAVFILKNFRAMKRPEDMMKGKHHTQWASFPAKDILSIPVFDEVNRRCQADRHRYEEEPPMASYLEFLFDVTRHRYYMWSACALCHEGMTFSADIGP